MVLLSSPLVPFRTLLTASQHRCLYGSTVSLIALERVRFLLLRKKGARRQLLDHWLNIADCEDL